MRPEKAASPRRGRTGAFIVVAGPDGAGKTTIARELIDGFYGPTAYFHFRPPFSQRMISAPPLYSDPPPSKGSPTGSKALGWLRLGLNFVRFWAGYVFRVLPAIARGVLVVGDRWAYGYVAQPHALKYYGPRWLAALAIRLMPDPDLVVNLIASPEVIHTRKQELSVEAIRDELERWRRIPAKNLVDLDAALPPAQVVTQISDLL